VETVLDHSDVETVLVATDNPINSAVVEPLFKALSDSILRPAWDRFGLLHLRHRMMHHLYWLAKKHAK
jgi:hypothetical protein